MDSALLVKPDTAAAEIFLRRLERSEFLVDAMFWLQYPESGEWRLIIASPVVDYSGPRNAYRWIQRVLEVPNGHRDLQLADLSVVGNGDQVLHRLRASARKATSDGWIQVRGATISDVSAGDALVFRMFPPAESGPETLAHETLFMPIVEETRLYWIVGGPSEWTSEPNDWNWCGYPQGMGSAQRKAQALSERITAGKVIESKELGDRRLGVLDADGVWYLIRTERNLSGAGQTSWTGAVIYRVPLSTAGDQVWQALSVLTTSARDAERTRVAKARGVGILWNPNPGNVLPVETVVPSADLPDDPWPAAGPWHPRYLGKNYFERMADELVECGGGPFKRIWTGKSGAPYAHRSKPRPNWMVETENGLRWTNRRRCSEPDQFNQANMHEWLVEDLRRYFKLKL